MIGLKVSLSSHSSNFCSEIFQLEKSIEFQRRKDKLFHFVFVLIGLQHPVRERRVHQHRGGAAPLRGHDQDGQDLQGPVHLRHLLQEHHLRHDVDKGPGHDFNHLGTGGASAQVYPAK